MNWYQIVTAVLVGSVIGYSTNWVAIRMLFRPHYEKRIGGVRVPFTPGVIPRGKKRLASGMADMVGGMLITDESVVQHLSQPKAEQQVRQHVAARLAKTRQKQLTVGQVLAELGIDDNMQQKYMPQVADFLANLAQSNAARTAVTNLLADLTLQLLNKPVVSTLGGQGLPKLRAFFAAWPKAIFKEQNIATWQDMLARRIEYFLNSPEPLKDYLPTAVQEGIHQFIADEAPRIASTMEQYINSPGARKAIKNRVEDLFEGTAFKEVLGGIVRLFNGSDRLTERLVQEISGFLSNEQIMVEIIDRLHLLADEALEKSISEVTAALDTVGKREKSAEIAAWLVEKISSPGAAYTVLEALEKILEQHQTQTWLEFFRWDHQDAADRLGDFYQGLCSKLFDSRTFKGNLSTLLQAFLEKMRQKKAHQILDLIESSGLNPTDTVLALYRFLVQKRVPGLLRFININAMVERQVEQQDVQQVEQMLLSIMRRELVAITWLGGFLGALLGFVTAGMQILMK